MLNVQEAKKIIFGNCNSLKTELLPLKEANGYVLAETVYSFSDTPPFNQSAMDGYAFSFQHWDGKSGLSVKGEIQAGTFFPDVLKPFEAVRIYTGAALLAGADTVIMQEKIIVTGKSITIKDQHLSK